MAMLTPYLESPFRSELALTTVHPEVFSGIKVLVALAQADA